MSTKSVKESRGSYLADAAKEIVATVSESSFDAATFFEKFELLAEIPNASGKLRDLVLRLAVRGSLVEQVPTDETSLSLLNKIHEARASLIEDSQIARVKDPVLKDEGRLFALPAGWTWTTLSSLCELITKGSSPKWQGVSYVERNGGLLFLTSENVGNYSLRKLDSLKYVEPKFNEIEPRSILNRGDVLLTLVGASIGRTAVFDLDEFANINQAVALIRIVRGFQSQITRYLLHYLNSPVAIELMLSSRVTTAQPNISLANAKEFPIPLPPLAEQKRIVGKVDELMGLCDRLEALEAERKERHASLSRAALARFADSPTPTNLQFLFHNSFDVEPAKLRAAIKNVAIRGLLLKASSTEESKELKAFSAVTPKFEIPDNWIWTTLTAIGDCKTGKTPPTKDPENYGPGFDFIGPGQITDFGAFLPAEKHLTSIGLENTSVAEPGDVLMVCIGGSIGKAAISDRTMAFNQQINCVRLRYGEPKYVYTVLTSEYFQNAVIGCASGSATPIINKGKWGQIPIPVPPLSEQKRIVAKVDELMALVDQLEQQLAHSRTLGQQLLEAVVANLTTNHG